MGAIIIKIRANRFRKAILFHVLMLSIIGTIFGAMVFDGLDDTVNSPAISELDGLNAMTVSFWAKTTDTPATDFVSRWGTDRQFICSSYAVNGLRAYWRYGGSGGLGSSLEHIGNPLPVNYGNGEWHHYVYMYSNPTSYIYFDGFPAGTASGSGGALNISVSDAVQLSKQGTTYHGTTMDDVRIYKRALSVSEIESLAFSKSRLVVTEDLVIWWRLDEGLNGARPRNLGAIIDYSGNGYHGHPLPTTDPTAPPSYVDSNYLNYVFYFLPIHWVYI